MYEGRPVDRANPPAHLCEPRRASDRTSGRLKVGVRCGASVLDVEQKQQQRRWGLGDVQRTVWLGGRRVSTQEDSQP